MISGGRRYHSASGFNPVQVLRRRRLTRRCLPQSHKLLRKIRDNYLVQVNGESFRGPWSIVTATYYNDKTPGTPATIRRSPICAFAWDAVYGEGYYVSTILGSEKRWTASRYRR